LFASPIQTAIAFRNLDGTGRAPAPRASHHRKTPQWVFFLPTTAVGVTYTWTWLSSSQKLFPVLLFHSLSNITVKTFPEPKLIGGVARSTYVGALLSAALALALTLFYGKQLCLSNNPSHSPR
jgi:membrane protease YdiL (CAAX protease family)